MGQERHRRSLLVAALLGIAVSASSQSLCQKATAGNLALLLPLVLDADLTAGAECASAISRSGGPAADALLDALLAQYGGGQEAALEHLLRISVQTRIDGGTRPSPAILDGLAARYYSLRDESLRFSTLSLLATSSRHRSLVLAEGNRIATKMELSGGRLSPAATRSVTAVLAAARLSGDPALAAVGIRLLELTADPAVHDSVRDALDEILRASE